MPVLTNKVAIVTGAIRGLGAASVIRLAERGFRVIPTDVEDLANSDVPDLGPHLTDYQKLDVRSADEWKALISRVIEQYGQLDALHLNAGVVSRPVGQRLDDDPLYTFSEEVLERVAAVNINGVAFGIMAALPHLQHSKGSIIITASLAGLRGMTADPIYCMTKHAVVGLAKALSARLAQDGVTISVVCPGGMRTRMVPEHMLGVVSLAEPENVGMVVAELALQERKAGIWLTPDDGSVRWYECDPLAHTEDQISQPTISMS